MTMTRASEPRRRRVLVTGATGFVGCALLPVLHDSGWDVTAALRRLLPDAGSSSLAAPAHAVVLGEFGPETDWSAALHPADGDGGAAPVDAVVHLAARVHVMR